MINERSTHIAPARATVSQDRQERAYLLIDECRAQILAMPAFKGQKQITDSLKRTLNLACWSNS